MSKKIRIGVIGGGIYGTQMLKCFAGEQARSRVELAGLADLSNDVLKIQQAAFGVKGYTDYNIMMDEARLDAVAIATPDHLHANAITAAAIRGLHIISQKPLDVDLERTKMLIQHCERAGVLLYVDFHKRFDPAHIRLRNEIAAGMLGKLQYGCVHMEDRITVPTIWLKNWAAHSSPSWFLGVHFYDLVYWLTGLMPCRVLASGYKGKLESMGFEGVYDSIQARVEYASGFSVNYDLSWILPESFPSIVNQGIRLVGEEGIAEVDSQDRGYFMASSKQKSDMIINPYGALEQEHPIFGPLSEGYTFQSMSYFIDLLQALANGMKIEDFKGKYPDGRAALISTQIGVAVDRSIASNAPVQI